MGGFYDIISGIVYLYHVCLTLESQRPLKICMRYMMNSSYPPSYDHILTPRIIVMHWQIYDKNLNKQNKFENETSPYLVMAIEYTCVLVPYIT